MIFHLKSLIFRFCGDCEDGTLKDCFKTGCVPANGVERVFMSINQQFPSPTINVCKGDRIIVDVKNHIPGVGISYHWHGIHQKGTPWYDGVAMTTQCPINTAQTFRYAFYATEPGTHMAHAHTAVHRSNGLVGKLIVREVNDPNAKLYDYDLDEHSVLLVDWDNTLAEDYEPGIRDTPRKPDTVLINGFGIFFDMNTKKYANAPIAAFYLQRGKRHRFRLVNGGSRICPFELSVGIL